eukprot:2957230-Rhodomonas_salina.1
MGGLRGSGAPSLSFRRYCTARRPTCSATSSAAACESESAAARMQRAAGACARRSSNQRSTCSRNTSSAPSTLASSTPLPRTRKSSTTIVPALRSSACAGYAKPPPAGSTTDTLSGLWPGTAHVPVLAPAPRKVQAVTSVRESLGDSGVPGRAAAPVVCSLRAWTRMCCSISLLSLDG